MKYCTKCVIPETAETHEFSDKNVCSVCHQIEDKKKINWDERQNDLDQLILEYKDKYDYDCIVPFSGGKDSVFALWYLVTQKKLKPLVLRFDLPLFLNRIPENQSEYFAFRYLVGINRAF